VSGVHFITVKKLCPRVAPLLAATSVLVACTPAHVVQGNGPAGTQVSSPSQLAGGGPHALVYPVTARVGVTDDYSGTRVSDPYRWLENLDSEVTRRWVEEENRLSQPRLEALPQRAWVKQRLTQLWDYERFSAPVKEGSRYFYQYNDGKQNQSVLYVSDALDSPGRVLFDPNSVREDATVALADFTPSPNGNLVAYALSDGGTDWETWKFRSAKDGSDLPDTLRFTKFWGVSWARDASGVYYSRYPALPNGKGDDAGRPAIYFHRRGEPQERDRLIFAVTVHPTRVPAGRVTEDGRFLVIILGDG